ncbi:MAG: AAA family ATPase, partial [Rudanella sp.]|nr:AAA family ATPase [Rudanella sp.]
AGMYRTLIHIMELHLSAEGTVILIDEFENSLGVNCIDELTTEVKGAVGRIQFIITSHHPYIINSISTANWKIVTREGGRVRAQDAETFNIGRSKHEAFIQLLNLPAYTTGHL